MHEDKTDLQRRREAAERLVRETMGYGASERRGDTPIDGRTLHPGYSHSRVPGGTPGLPRRRRLAMVRTLFWVALGVVLGVLLCRLVSGACDWLGERTQGQARQMYAMIAPDWRAALKEQVRATGLPVLTLVGHEVGAQGDWGDKPDLRMGGEAR